MNYMTTKFFILFVACAVLFPAIVFSDEPPAEKKAELVVAIFPIQAPAKVIKTDDLNAFVDGFFTRDSRYRIVSAIGKDTTHSLKIQFAIDKKKKKLNLKVTGAVVGGESMDYTAVLPARPNQILVESEIARGIRSLFDFKPEKQTVLLRIVAEVSEGDGDGGSVEDRIYQEIRSEFNQVLADPYKLPVKNSDVPKLYKGDKKTLATLEKEANARILIAGTITIPATKNVGGAADPMYQGKAVVRIRAWDLKRHVVISDVRLDLHAKGIFSELVYSLMDAAGEQSAKQIKKDLGFPEPQAEAQPE